MHFSTTREAADAISRTSESRIHEWQVRRLFEDGDVPEPPKFGGKRMVADDLIPAIVDALRDRGWLPLSDSQEVGTV